MKKKKDIDGNLFLFGHILFLIFVIIAEYWMRGKRSLVRV